ncbi:hypothetical protein M885DRAFT_542392 [Pelagophyceae sp. CCMP2097]|nr:hypothetical protein M885DRAFT_542392 [Pelagophyceae sp. CCMP2097]
MLAQPLCSWQGTLRTRGLAKKVLGDDGGAPALHFFEERRRFVRRPGDAWTASLRTATRARSPLGVAPLAPAVYPRAKRRTDAGPRSFAETAPLQSAAPAEYESEAALPTPWTDLPHRGEPAASSPRRPATAEPAVRTRDAATWTRGDGESDAHRAVRLAAEARVDAIGREARLEALERRRREGARANAASAADSRRKDELIRRLTLERNAALFRAARAREAELEACFEWPVPVRGGGVSHRSYALARADVEEREADRDAFLASAANNALRVATVYARRAAAVERAAQHAAELRGAAANAMFAEIIPANALIDVAGYRRNKSRAA